MTKKIWITQDQLIDLINSRKWTKINKKWLINQKASKEVNNDSKNKVDKKVYFK